MFALWLKEMRTFFYFREGLLIMAIWAYVRVSTREQNEDRQVEELKDLVTTESHLIIEKQSGN